MKKFALTIRKVHKFLMIFLGGQFILWSLSGLYMVTMDIDFIHGDHLVKEPFPIVISSTSLLSFQEILQQYPRANKLRLTHLAGQSVYQFNVNKQAQLISAQTGKSLLPFSKEYIKKLAILQSNLSNDLKIENIQLLTTNAPSELSSRHLPVWQVVYDDISASTLYISSSTGQVVTKRHDYWRLFDFAWMLHIMDYENREDITNWLLFVFSLTGVFSCLSGLYLVGHRFRFAVKLNTILSVFKRQPKRKAHLAKENDIKSDGKCL